MTWWKMHSSFTVNALVYSYPLGIVMGFLIQIYRAVFPLNALNWQMISWLMQSVKWYCFRVHEGCLNWGRKQWGLYLWHRMAAISSYGVTLIHSPSFPVLPFSFLSQYFKLCFQLVLKQPVLLFQRNGNTIILSIWKSSHFTVGMTAAFSAFNS